MSPEQRFEVFFKTHYVSLCQGVYRLIRDESLAEDLVQEVFLKVWEKRNRLELNEQFIGYLKKSCYHEALQFLASKPVTLEVSNEYNSTDNHPENDPLISKELETSILSGINLLPEKTRLIFTLSRYELMTYPQIADQLQLSIKAVEKHMSKALKILRDHLKDFLILLLTQYFL